MVSTSVPHANIGLIGSLKPCLCPFRWLNLSLKRVTSFARRGSRTENK